MASAWLVGAARRALRIAVDYTTSRRAFGVPIASYQSVAHRMADLTTSLDGALLLTRKAAWAADQDSDRRRELALMASGLAAEVSEQAATDALHFHGGYGFMLEYDIQLYLRRVKGLALLDGDPTRELRLLADELWEPSR
jgi:alkylation response protein AidB-like acyl-CoA dehydrogenase